MIIYKDIAYGHEMFSESLVAKDIENDLFLVCRGKYIVADCDEDTPEDEVEKVLDIPYRQGLDELAADTFTPKMFYTNIKAFLKPITKKIKDEQGEDAKNAYMEKVKEFMNEICKKENFKDHSFYIHTDDYEHLENCMVVICKWEGADPLFYFWKEGLKTEKC